MGPLWFGQGTVSQTTTVDLLSTDVLVSPTGAPVGAGEKTVTHGIATYHYSSIYIPADAVLVEEVTMLLTMLVPNTASTLTLLLLPGSADNM